MATATLGLESATIAELETIFASAATDDRDLAEIAYALMCYFYKKGDCLKAALYGMASSSHFRACQIEDMVSSVSRHLVIAGIPMPDLIHEGVVEFWMKKWGLLSRRSR